MCAQGAQGSWCAGHAAGCFSRPHMHACARAGYCMANNTCGSGPFPTAPDVACDGFNPEGGSLGTLPRCAMNAYDNNNYLTLDFTCDTGACNVDGDCPVVRALRHVHCLLQALCMHARLALVSCSPLSLHCAGLLALAACVCESRGYTRSMSHL